MLHLMAADAGSGSSGGAGPRSRHRVCPARGQARGASLCVPRRRGNLGAATLPSRSSTGRGGAIRRGGGQRAARGCAPCRDIGSQNKRRRLHRVHRKGAGVPAAADSCSRDPRAPRPAFLAAVRMVSLLEELARPEDCCVSQRSRRRTPGHDRAARLRSGWRRGISGPRPWSGTASAKSPRRTLPARSRCQAVDVVSHRSRLQERACRRAAWLRSGSLPGACGTTLKNCTDSSRLPRSACRPALLDQFIADVGREQADVLCRICVSLRIPQPPDGRVHRRVATACAVCG